MSPSFMKRAITIRGNGGFVPICIARGVINRGLKRFTPAHHFNNRSNGEGWTGNWAVWGFGWVVKTEGRVTTRGLGRTHGGLCFTGLMNIPSSPHGVHCMMSVVHNVRIGHTLKMLHFSGGRTSTSIRGLLHSTVTG